MTYFRNPYFSRFPAATHDTVEVVEYNDETPIDEDDLIEQAQLWARSFYDGAKTVTCDWSYHQEYDDEDGYRERPGVNRLIVRDAQGQELAAVDVGAMSDAALLARFEPLVREMRERELAREREQLKYWESDVATAERSGGRNAGYFTRMLERSQERVAAIEAELVPSGQALRDLVKQLRLQLAPYYAFDGTVTL